MTVSVVFRVDASRQVGLGHLVRCRALAEELVARGVRCTMVGPSPDHQLPADCELFSSWRPVADWEGEVEDARRLLAVADEVGAHRLVLDDYRVRVAFQRELGAAAAPPWLLTAPHEGDEIRARWIYNANPSARVDAYQTAAVDPEAEYLVGPRYALLRREFQAARSASPEREGVPTVLLAFGGGDDRGAATFAIDALMPVLGRIRLVVLAGPDNPGNAELARVVRETAGPTASLQVGPPRVAQLFAAADIGLLAAGTATFEAAVCGVPMVLVPVSDNQVGQARAWEELGVATALSRYGSVSGDELCAAVESLLDDPAERERRAGLARTIVDGRGASRVADALLGV